LKKKYYKEDGGDKKAVLQLVERMELLFSDADIYDAGRNRAALRIYPILLVSETAMLTPGINHLLNKWFRKEVDLSDNLKSKKQQIHELVILDINSLILYNDQFRQNGNLLKVMIEGYERQVTAKRMDPLPPGVTNERQLEALAMSMLVPFTFYLREKIKVAAPGLFYEYAKAIFPEGDLAKI